MEVETKGNEPIPQGHNENIGAGAIFEMSRILNAFYEEVRGEEYLTFNPGTLLEELLLTTTNKPAVVRSLERPM